MSSYIWPIESVRLRILMSSLLQIIISQFLRFSRYPKLWKIFFFRIATNIWWRKFFCWELNLYVNRCKQILSSFFLGKTGYNATSSHWLMMSQGESPNIIDQCICILRRRKHSLQALFVLICDQISLRSPWLSGDFLGKDVSDLQKKSKQLIYSTLKGKCWSWSCMNNFQYSS